MDKILHLAILDVESNTVVDNKDSERLEMQEDNEADDSDQDNIGTTLNARHAFHDSKLDFLTRVSLAYVPNSQAKCWPTSKYYCNAGLAFCGSYF